MERINFGLLIQKLLLFILLIIILSQHFPPFQNKIPLLEATRQDISLQYFHSHYYFSSRENQKLGQIILHPCISLLHKFFPWDDLIMTIY